MSWHVYIILCSDGSLYTGITTDIERRFAEHGGREGASYFRGRAPQRLVHLERALNRSIASRREAEIKKLRRPDKQRLIQSDRNELVARGDQSVNSMTVDGARSKMG